MTLRSVTVMNTAPFWLAAIAAPTTPKAALAATEPADLFVPRNDTCTRSDGSRSPSVEAPIRASVLILAALGGGGIGPAAPIRPAWRDASEDAAAVGLSGALSAAMVAAWRPTASPPIACWHHVNHCR